MSTRIQKRRGTAAAWTSANPVLAAGEEGWETDTHKGKTGDGSTAWTSLLYDVVPDVLGTFASLASATFGATPNNSRLLYGIGDSIINNGLTSTPIVLAGKSILQWACLLSGTRFRWGGNASTAGYTTAQVRSTHLPTVLAATPKPGACLVLAGTNGVGSVALASQLADLLYIWQQLQLAGITPIAATIPPSGGASADDAALLYLNAGIKRYAAQIGVAVVDFYEAVVDHTNATANQYVTAYDNGDGIHPSEAGAKAMGTALAVMLADKFNDSASELLTANTNPTGALISNNLLLTPNGGDANLPNGWSIGGSGGTSTYVLGADPATTLVGNVLTMTRGDTNLFFRTAAFNLTAGRRYLMGCRIKTANVALNSGRVSVRVRNAGDGSIIAAIEDWHQDIPASTLLLDFTAPSLPSASYEIEFRALDAACTLSVGQVTALDLTTMGVV